MEVHFAPLINFNWTLVMILVTFLVLYLILKKYFFGKLHKFMEARQQKIVDAFDNAAAANTQAEARLSEYNEKVEAIAQEKRETLTEAKKKADEIAKEIIAEAEDKAEKLLKKTRDEIELEKERAVQDMRDQVAMLSVFAAEKIIEKKLDEKEQMAIIDEVIKDADNLRIMN